VLPRSKRRMHSELLLSREHHTSVATIGLHGLTRLFSTSAIVALMLRRFSHARTTAAPTSPVAVPNARAPRLAIRVVSVAAASKARETTRLEGMRSQCLARKTRGRSRLLRWYRHRQIVSPVQHRSRANQEEARADARATESRPEFARSLPSERAVSSYLVVVSPPLLDPRPSVPKVDEPVLVEELVARSSSPPPPRQLSALCVTERSRHTEATTMM